jgi:hypothetical protein
MGVEDSTHLNEVMLSYASCELVTSVVSSGAVAVASASLDMEENEQAGVAHDEPSSLVGVGPIKVVSIAAPRATSVAPMRRVRHQSTDARIEARLIVSQALREQKQRCTLPVLSARIRRVHALGRGAEVEAFKATVRLHRYQADRAAPNKSMRLENLSSRGARMLRTFLDTTIPAGTCTYIRGSEKILK